MTTLRSQEPQPLLAADPPRRIAVFRALRLGDTLCAVPALRALRAACPDAEVTLVALPWARRLLGRLDRYVDRLAAFPGWPGLPERSTQTARLPAFLQRMQRRRFDLAIQLHGSGQTTNPLVSLFGARRTACFVGPGSWAPDPALAVAWPERGRETDRLLTLMRRLGAPARGSGLEFPVLREDREALCAAPGAAALEPGGYACLHPGAGDPAKRWEPKRFAAVGDALAARGLDVVLTGTEAEAPIIRAVAAAMRTPALDLAGPMGLGALAALLSDARLVVCNDTGVSHLAAAVGAPSVVVFLKADPERWAPADTMLHRVVYDARSCPTRAPGAEPVGAACAHGVEARHVLARAELLLEATMPPLPAAGVAV